MSAATQTALIVAGIGFAGTMIAAPFVNAWLQRRNARRAAHEPAVGAARLIKREMEQIHSEAQTAFAQGRESDSFPSSEWDQHKAKVASRLSQEELLVLDRFYAIAKAGAAPAILALYSTASQAISWLARGETSVIKPRKTEISLAPVNMDVPCRCGHIFGPMAGELCDGECALGGGMIQLDVLIDGRPWRSRSARCKGVAARPTKFCARPTLAGFSSRSPYSGRRRCTMEAPVVVLRAGSP